MQTSAASSASADTGTMDETTTKLIAATAEYFSDLRPAQALGLQPRDGAARVPIGHSPPTPSE